ncbi:MAG: FAD-binding oxidoreductase [Halobacteriovoraceae bacterium]|nr:FAD-binding oxidoreductase [Halobacteriovoraceae bacterium]
MSLIKKTFKTIDELKKHLKTHAPTFYYSSQTSTVIPYDKIADFFKNKEMTLGDLSQLPCSMELTPTQNLIVKGAISWKDAKDFLRSKKRNIMTSPTEELALISAGAATSATGERCFHFGNLRSQIISLTYLNFDGNEVKLNQDIALKNTSNEVKKYQKDYAQYDIFKNAPFPRLETQTDLMIGTEGQLGIITEIEIKTTDDFPVNHLFILLPKWEVDSKAHLEIINKVQKFRNMVILCELIDANSFEYLPKADRPNKEMDAIFFEIKTQSFNDFYEQFVLNLEYIDQDHVFELAATKFHNIRASIPRAVFEKNSQMGVVKKGTDVQVSVSQFETLLKIYQNFTKLGIKYNLFGHFGDAHLHFNFMPLPNQVELCHEQLELLYGHVLKLNASPFAEHGIGIIKQKYIPAFWNQNTFKVFKQLKDEHDPYKQFFPQGFMSLEDHS